MWYSQQQHALIPYNKPRFTPPTQTEIEYQLVAQHPNVYPPLVPLDVESLDFQLLGIKPLTTRGQTIDRNSSLSRVQGPCMDQSETIDPYMLGKHSPDSSPVGNVDARLRYLDIAQWTSVKINNKFASEAITLYLEMNQPWWAFFDKNLFIDDLVSGKSQFCSRLLVNALLAWASVSPYYFQVYYLQPLMVC